jgi:hypothetical protein
MSYQNIPAQSGPIPPMAALHGIINSNKIEDIDLILPAIAYNERQI